MRALVIIAVTLAGFAATPAFAIKRYNADKLACGEIRSIIANDGAAIMRYRSKRDPSLVLYDRYVRDRFFCAWREDAVPAWIPSRDKASCLVRRCEIPVFPHDDLMFRRFPHN
ncbi:MAG: hypothetical protein IPL47_09250 [Phyllobacteriaceae bacterium]|nr:hypothetical protein [Phyllobacteriaceae bacterium]